jgi:azurin
MTCPPVALAQVKAPQAKPASPAGAQAPAPKPSAGAAARTIELQGSDNLKYTPSTITAKPGETIRVVLKTISNMPKMAMSHNFVLLGAKVDVTSFVNDSLRAGATKYIPVARKADILASTGLAGKGETVEVTFTAPKAPGTYTFVCTFPGHFAGGMKGTLTVK